MTDGSVSAGLPVSSLLRAAALQIARIFGLEVESAKREMIGKAKAAGTGVALVVVAFVFVALAAVALTVCATLALGLVVAGWLAALIVTVAWLAIAGILALIGINLVRKALPPAPTDTLASLKEDVQWEKIRPTSAKA